MNKINSFHIKIDKNTLCFKSESHKNMFHNWLKQWEGKEVMLEISEKKSKRSSEQNRYYFFYLELIESETGNDKETLHSYFKNKFLTTNITELYGDKVRVAKSTTELTKGQFCEYLVNISGITGVELPDTTEFWGVSYHK